MDIDKITEEIGKIDQQLLNLLNRRALQVMEAGRLKQASGQEIFSSDRQAYIWRNLLPQNRGPLSEQAVKYLFGEIMAACSTILNPLKVGFLGPLGSFCHQASLHYLGSSCQFMDLPSVVDVFAEVSRGHCQLGVVPVENSNETDSDATLDQFFTTDLQICGEIYAPNNLTLFSLNSDLNKITDVYANPLTLSQCRGWLSRNLPYAGMHERAGVTAAIDSITDKPNAAALGSKLAASLSKMNILAEDLSDLPQNTTRFLVLGKQSPPPTGHDKTSIMFHMAHKPGFLYNALGYFKDLNLSRIESRPSLGKPWEYSLFIDMPGHVEDQEVQMALSGLKQYAGEYKLLGAYPRG